VQVACAWRPEWTGTCSPELLGEKLPPLLPDGSCAPAGAFVLYCAVVLRCAVMCCMQPHLFSDEFVDLVIQVPDSAGVQIAEQQVSAVSSLCLASTTALH
jgi:hypothetical protein